MDRFIYESFNSDEILLPQKFSLMKLKVPERYLKTGKCNLQPASQIECNLQPASQIRPVRQNFVTREDL